MSTSKELGEAWFGCQAEMKHLKDVINFKETQILTLQETIQRLKRKSMKRQKRDAEKKAVFRKSLRKTLWPNGSISENTVINYF